MNDVRILTFAEVPQPITIEDKSGYMKSGEDNLYPTYLLDLFNKSPKHGAILQSKAGYISGNGWKAEDEADLYAKSFIQSANEYESLKEVTDKCILDYEIYNGFYLQVNWSLMGAKIASIFHVDFCKVRTNKDNTQFWYNEDWENPRKKKTEIYPAFDVDNPKGTQILFVKSYRPNMGAYSIPNYISSLNYIQSDVEISKHVLGNAKGGFSSSKQITFVNGEPPEEEAKRIIEKKFKEKFTGSEGSKIIVEFAKSADQKTLITDLGQSDLTKEDFTTVNALIRQEIYAGHRVSNPALFGIESESAFNNQGEEVKVAYEVFKNTYVSERQQSIEIVFNYLASFRGVKSKLKIVGTAPLLENVLTPELLPYLPKEFIYEKLGIDMSKYAPITPETTGPTQQLSTNDNIKNLTGRQHQNIERISRKVQQGKMSMEQAVMLLKSGYGLTDEEANTMLSVQSNFSDEDIISIFAEFGEHKDDYIVWKEKQLFSDAVDEEINRMEFEEEFTKLELQVLGLIDNNKLIDSEAISKALKIEVSEADNILASLLDKGIIDEYVNKVGSIERTLTKPLSEITDKKVKTTSFRVMYAYDWRTDVPSGERNSSAHPSRPFCVKMMGLNKLWSRTDIEQISQRLGYDVFERVGGYWNDNGDIKYHCRHTWGSKLVIKKNKSNG